MSRRFGALDLTSTPTLFAPDLADAPDPDDAGGAPAPKKLDQPEHRFSFWFDHFLDRVVLEPCWYSAVDHSGPVGNKGDSPEMRRIRRMRWEQRQRAMGIKPSGVDWPAILQFDPVTFAVTAVCWIELKHGKNQPTDGQRTTMRLLGERGQVVGAAWNIHDCLQYLRAARFRLHGNADNIAVEVQGRLDAAHAAAPARLAKRAKARGKPRPARRVVRKGGISTAMMVSR